VILVLLAEDTHPVRRGPRLDPWACRNASGGVQNDRMRGPASTEEDGWTTAARLGVMVLAVAMPLATLVYFPTLLPFRTALAGLALGAVVVTIHLSHLRHGLRDEAPPHGRLTFALMVAGMAAGEAVVGAAWTYMFASLVASALLVFRPPWSVLWAVGVTLSCLVFTDRPLDEGGTLITVVVAFRSTTLFGLVWFVAGVHRLRVARAALAGRAVARERARVDAELMGALSVQLEHIEATARRAGAALAGGDVRGTRRELAQATGDTRAALGIARDVVADMRHGGSHDDLRAAARFLVRAERDDA
jgi:hypothetical protein